MDEDYKGHHIRSVPRQLPESGRWTAHVVINWTAGSREEIRQFEVKRGFATQEEAEREGLTNSAKKAATGHHLGRGSLMGQKDDSEKSKMVSMIWSASYFGTEFCKRGEFPVLAHVTFDTSFLARFLL